MPDDEWQAISLSYTSGTTGNPKGVVYHHRGSYLMSTGSAVAWNMPNRLNFLTIVPMFHCNGWCYPWTIAMLNGRTICLRNIDVKKIFELIDQYNVSLKLSNCGDKEKLRLMPEAIQHFAQSPKANFKFVIENTQDLKEVLSLTNDYNISSSKVALMPQAQTAEQLLTKQLELIETCKMYGFNYSDRLHVRIYGDKKGV